MQHRSMQVRSINQGADGYPIVTARAVAYNVIDSFGTRFLPGCFTRSLGDRQTRGDMPTIRWGHQAGEPIGKVQDFQDSADGLDVTFRLDADPWVPRAMQAITQLRSGTLTDVSVGFSGKEERGADGVPEFREIDLNEVSLVAEGAVPGAKVLALRSKDVVPAEVAAQLVAQLGGGQIDLLGALQGLRDATVAAPAQDEKDPETTEEVETEPEEGDPAPETPDAEPGEPTEGEPVADADIEALNAEADAALDAVAAL